MKILIDNGHGAETPGKRSPDGLFREYRWARDIAARIVEELRGRSYDAELLVPEERDMPLSERCHRVNTLCAQVGKADILLVSVHVNAAGNGSGWMTARGWSAHVSLNAGAQSKELARALIASAEDRGGGESAQVLPTGAVLGAEPRHLPGHGLRRRADREPLHGQPRRPRHAQLQGGHGCYRGSSCTGDCGLH